MQLEPQTARDLPGWSPGARMVPQENLILGAELLGGLHRFLGSWRLAAAAYYGGLGAVVVSLIVVALTRSGHPRTAAATAHHRTAPLAGSAGDAATKESEAEARSDP
jgi:soluble lytic murein transglycosylase-like protein